jgi:hypothetical protein
MLYQIKEENMRDKVLATYKRGHLIDILHEKKPGVGTRVATFNCNTRKLTLDDAPNNILLYEQVFLCASLEQMYEENKEE